METTFLIIFTLLFLFFQTDYTTSSNTWITASSNITCIEKERHSLLVFKQGLTKEFSRLSTWTGVECCEWEGVECDRRNGHVVKLDLRCPLSFTDDYTLNKSNCFEGKVSPSLLNLEHLRYLDLSMNNFSGQNIPEFLGSFKYLEYLDLSYSEFSGAIPPHLGNLSRLQNLDLNNNNDLMVKNGMRWVSLLSSLKHLDFSGISIGNHIDWFHPISMLPSLLTLNLASCDINISSIKFINFTSLRSLDLSSNGMNSTIPVWLLNLTSLVHLNVRNNNFHGGIPNSIETLSSLSYLDLSRNRLSGNIPESVGLLTRLQVLIIAYNQLSGNIPTSLGQLSNLQTLGLSYNQLSGVVSEIHFTKLYNLTWLSLSGNSLITWNVSRHWIPPFQLDILDASSCSNMGPQFPNWLQTQTHHLEYLWLSNSSIRDTIPEWFHNISSHLQVLDLSDNEIHGNLPRLNMNNTGLQVVNLRNNHFTRSMPTHLCELHSLQVLDLSHNNFFGILPGCLGSLIHLRVIDFTSNNITGDIPNSLGSLSPLESLHLCNNKIEGNLPLSLQNLKSLVTMDLGNNLLTDNIPFWIGKKLSKLKVLSLQSNMFMGMIPLKLCQIKTLQHLNLANNKITGNIPHCFCNLTGMIKSDVKLTYRTDLYEENIEAYIKGIKLTYTSTIRFLISLDLSSNKLIGEIPDVLTNLESLTNLNLSRNELSGHIPTMIGNLKSMESLDLSTNKLSGRIPPSLASVNSLGYLNLSFNNLSGPLPNGNHFQTFDNPATFEGNKGLCGFPVLRSCIGKIVSYTHVGDKAGKVGSQGFSWFYAGMVPGFVVGFMGLIVSLHYIKIWRVIYFEMIENVYVFLMVLIIVTFARLRRKFF